MIEISKGSTTHSGILSDIENVWSTSFNSIIPFLLRKTGENAFSGYLKSGAADHFIEIDEFNKIRYEIARWQTAIGFSHEELKSMSSTLHELQKANDLRALTRTLRMLKFFDVLLVTHDNSYTTCRTLLEKYSKELLEDSVSGLMDAISVIRDTHIKIHRKHEYYTSLALLMVVAVALSQCEAFRPLFWEARSAARARDELKRKWGNANDGVLEVALDIVTLLIRYQSAPGQYARKTGDEKFRETIKELTNEYNSVLKEQHLIAALTVMGVLEEARNHRLPFTQDELHEKSDKIGDIDLNAGLNREWDQEKVKEIPKKIQRIGNGAKHTWGYASSLLVTPEYRKYLDTFKDFFEKYVTTLTILDGQRLVEGEVAEFTFDRSQTEDLRDLVAEYVKKVVESSDRESMFKQCFEVRIVSVPNCFGQGKFGTSKKTELVVELLLNDYIAATQLLFEQRDIGIRDGSGPSYGKTAGDLFIYLFERAKNFFQLESGRLHENQKFYMPFPLMRRMLDIVYRLCPETCMSIPIIFDGSEQMSVPVPTELLKDKHRDIIACIANFIPALVLNRAMSLGFHSCDVGLDSLVDSPSDLDSSSQSMRAQDWKQEIEEAFHLNAYSLLVEKYLRDYNTERDCVQWLRTSRSSTLLPISINGLIDELAYYANNDAKYNGHNKYFFLGIDIGGTFIKFQFYEFSPTDKKFSRAGKFFRMLTSQQDISKNNLAENTVQEKSPAEQFARRIIDTIKMNIKDETYLNNCIVENRVIALGISWPGPVRGNRIAGTSGILKQFPPLRREIKDNKIEDIMRLDIVKALRNVWVKREVWENIVDPGVKRKYKEPFVAIVNDGSAEGMGAVANLVLSEKAAPNGRLLVVKLGTGTAGAVFNDGRLSPSLTEWGKMLLDLAAYPKLLDPELRPKDFPEGTANHYLSSKTMPRLAMSVADGLFDVKELDSLELGLLLEAGAKDLADLEGLRKLRHECGIREYARRGMRDPVDVEELRRLIETGTYAEPALFELIQLQVAKLGREASGRLNEMIEVYGGVRLANLLNVTDDDILDTFGPGDSRPQVVTDKLVHAYARSKSCVNMLGNYLGDFIVLLYDIYRMPVVIASGGVLSGVTGKMVVSQAVERTKKYGLSYDDKGDGILVLSSTETIKSSTRGEKSNFGTLGAAVFSASEFLFDLKQQGLDAIKARLMKLTINQNVEIHKDVAIFKDTRIDEIKLAKYALTKEEVFEYLKMYGPTLNFYSSSTTDDGPLVFTQWVKEKI